MTMTTTPSATVETAAGGNPATVETVATPGSTPRPGPAEAGGKGGQETQERVAYLERELKTAIADRDLAKKRYLESGEGQALAERAALADKMLAEKQESERLAAEQRGEFQRLYETEKTRAKTLEEQVGARERAFRQTLARRELETAYSALGGIDPELFVPLAAKAVEEGTVKVGDDLSVTGGAEFLTRVLEAKPHLFRAQKEALATVRQQLAGGTDAARGPLENKQKTQNGVPTSLAEAHLQGTPMPPTTWRRLGLPKPQ